MYTYKKESHEDAAFSCFDTRFLQVLIRLLYKNMVFAHKAVFIHSTRSSRLTASSCSCNRCSSREQGFSKRKRKRKNSCRCFAHLFPLYYYQRWVVKRRCLHHF